MQKRIMLQLTQADIEVAIISFVKKSYPNQKIIFYEDKNCVNIFKQGEYYFAELALFP